MRHWTGFLIDKNRLYRFDSNTISIYIFINWWFWVLFSMLIHTSSGWSLWNQVWLILSWIGFKVCFDFQRQPPWLGTTFTCFEQGSFSDAPRLWWRFVQPYKCNPVWLSIFDLLPLLFQEVNILNNVMEACSHNSGLSLWKEFETWAPINIIYFYVLGFRPLQVGTIDLVQN